MKSNNKAIAPIAIIIAIALISGAGAGTYVVYENTKSADITPEKIIIDKNYNYDQTTPEPTITPEEITQDEAITSILAYLNEDQLTITDDIRSCIKSLNVKVYKLDDVTLEDVVAKYRAKMISDGYEILIDESRSGTGWSGTLLFAKGTLHGRAIVAVSGTSVTALFNCDVLLITSSGFLSEYYRCQDLIKTQVDDHFE